MKQLELQFNIESQYENIGSFYFKEKEMNAKEEFLLFVNDKRIKSTIKCAYISYYTDGNYINKKTILLKVNYTEKQFQDFLEKLDFEYDNYDNYDTTNHITGIIWFRDGSWGER